MLRIERWKEASTHEFMKIYFYLLRFCIFSLFFWLFYHGTVCATSEQASQWVHRYQYLFVVGISTGKQTGTDTKVEHSSQTRKICADTTSEVISFVKSVVVLQWNLEQSPHVL